MDKINMNEMKLSEIKKLNEETQAVLGGNLKPRKTHSIPVGKNVFVRTVTMHYTGKVVAVTDYDMVLENAAWIADTGRFSAFLNDGTPSEVEPFPDMAILPLGAIVDISPWNHELPRTVK